ncbi:cutinase [Colletotrichum truncatum]|uniref:Cutinase n=1 Tax=Colletotrichum truncatum TaxID=5467 RepID=A0ACC3Z932_COLTU|nr:cutinase [Colletotrichum truncatum]KAF6780792.1 cutinase [Colletotrichum truncatum]
MKAIVNIALAAIAASSPLFRADHNGLEITAQLNSRATGSTSKEFTEGGCRDVIFVFARGSTELGNMVRPAPPPPRLGCFLPLKPPSQGSTVGPPTSDGLKKRYGDDKVATEGVDYAASLETNLAPGGADPLAVAEMKRLLNDATEKCPKAKIVAGGYSQGAAVAHRAIESLSDAVKKRIDGVVTYGDTQKAQDKGQIPNFPKDKVKIICNDSDEVCKGTLEIEPAHLDYVRRVSEGVDFLVGKIGNI